MSTIFGPSSASNTPVGMVNRLYNGDFTFDPAGGVTVGDGATVFQNWYVLTQSGNVTATQLSYPEPGQFACARILQAHASAQRYGIAQRIAPEDCGDLRTAFLNAVARLRFSDEANLRWAVLAGTAGTLDVVNDWTSESYIPGQFFISGVEVVNQGVFRNDAGVFGSLPQIPYQGPDDLVYLYFFVWTQDTVAQNGTLDIGLAQVAEGLVTQPYEHRPYELSTAIQYAPSPAWGAVITQSTIAAGQALIDAGQPFTDVASAATVDLGAVASNLVRITGSTGPITSFGTSAAGVRKTIRFASTPTLTYNATSLILPGDANITAAADDSCVAISLGSGNWYVGQYQRGAGVPVSASAAGANLIAQSSLLAMLALLLPIGIALPYGGSSAPTGWVFAAGQNVSRSTYAALFAIYGTTYGPGDGSTTFGLPDYRGRAVFGKDDMGGSAANRLTNAGSGVDGVTLGAVGGNQLLQGHTHGVTDNIVTALTDTAGANNYATDAGANQFGAVTITTTSTGGGSSQNVPPAVVQNYIIFAGA